MARLSVIAAAMLAASPALAADEGFYAGVGGGITFMPDLDVDASAPGTSVTGDVSTGTGFAALGAAGYQFDTDPAPGRGLILGLEGEVGYRRASVDEYDFTGTAAIPGIGLVTATGTAPLDGSIDALTFMGNGRAGLDTDSSVTPFVLGGAGIARIGANDIDTGGTTLVDDSDWVFAYQAGGGIDVAFARGLSAELSYRFLGTTEAELTAADGVTQIDASYRSHTVLVMLKYVFGAR